MKKSDPVALGRLTAAIFSKYSLVISPVNWPLCAVNVLLFFSSLWHLARKVLSLV